jgi:glucose/arabinose dehydrogenase
MAFAPDGRLFVCQQGGELRVIRDGVLLAANFLSLTVDSVGERGLLGVAFDPGFATNGFVYVYHTVPGAPPRNRVSRFTAAGDVALPAGGVTVLDLDNLSFASNHNGGAIHFGPDGKLYVATGDNASAANAQSFANRLGKILRIEPDGSIPPDNPFFNTAIGANRAIWALGLRNPFTFAFQPGTGRMFINDVGQSTWEEIDEGFAGANYGWPACEGACRPANPAYRDPVFQYGHNFADRGSNGCSINGGAFYNPPVTQFPREFIGAYFFADYCSGWIRALDPGRSNVVTLFASGLAQPVDLQTGPDGRLYYLARGGGFGGAAGLVGAIHFVNQPPVFARGPDVEILEDAGPQTFVNWATGIAPGPAREAGQQVSFHLSIDRLDLFTTPPSLTPDGILALTPSPNAFGLATVTVVLVDEGGASFGGQDRSAPRPFTIRVLPVNDPPIADAGATVGRFLSPNNHFALVTLDGSRSSDVENDPLAFVWREDTRPIATGMVARAELSVGAHTLLLVVSDGSAETSVALRVEVLTAAEAIEELLAQTEAAELKRGSLQPLRARLRSAQRAFDRDDFDKGAGALRAYQKRIHSLTAKKELDAATAKALLAAAQRIIATVDGKGLVLPKCRAITCDKDGRVRLRFSGPPARSCVVEASNDLRQWRPLGVATETDLGEFEFEIRIESDTTPACRFFRLVAQ